mmetsp:Transcript_42842/g.84842  ORF Transcript_42842/g.84842 Transcript_42842/m.84842 type:complete len:224 (-) Transcript_42842:1264-1935(-)
MTSVNFRTESYVDLATTTHSKGRPMPPLVAPSKRIVPGSLAHLQIWSKWRSMKPKRIPQRRPPFAGGGQRQIAAYMDTGSLGATFRAICISPTVLAQLGTVIATVITRRISTMSASTARISPISPCQGTAAILLGNARTSASRQHQLRPQRQPQRLLQARQLLRRSPVPRRSQTRPHQQSPPPPQTRPHQPLRLRRQTLQPQLVRPQLAQQRPPTPPPARQPP